MGLFSILRKKSKAVPDAEFFPDLHTGMQVDVLTPTGVPLFRARIRLLGDEDLELRAADGGFLPRAVYGQPVRIQGVLKNGQGFALDGSVGPNAPAFWRIERLRLPLTGQHRDHYRQHLGLTGSFSFNESFKGQKHECKVLDISASGARLVTKTPLQTGGTVYLKIALSPGDSPYLIPCLIKRVQAHTRTGGRTFEYGCQFLKTDSWDQERLVQAIFALQRKELQTLRGR